eukprot:COSAG06_NODE_16436_length_1001_cov_40.018182_1_plen_56_part_00
MIQIHFDMQVLRRKIRGKLEESLSAACRYLLPLLRGRRVAAVRSGASLPAILDPL